METPTRRKVHDEAEARALLAELASSPESLSAFCGRLGIDGRSLACWQRNLTRRSRPTAGAVRLVELVAPPQRRAVYRVLVGDVAVEVEDDFVADTLVRLLDAVRVLSLPSSVRVYVALDPVDMRKGHHGLAAVVRDQLQLDPLSGHLVLFTNRRGNLMKLLWFDRTGLAILYKRLERGTFQLPRVAPGTSRVQVDAAQLAMILEGIDLERSVRRRRYRRDEDRPNEN